MASGFVVRGWYAVRTYGPEVTPFIGLVDIDWWFWIVLIVVFILSGLLINK